MDYSGPTSSDAGVGDVFPKTFQFARAGDEDCVGALLEYCRPYLLTIARAELPGDLQGKLGASDLVQDTLVRGVEHFTDFRGETQEELARWLRRILLNRLSNIREAYAAGRRSVALEQPADSGLLDPHHETPSRQVQQRENERRLTDALLQLPEQHRQIIELRHRENRSFAQIAAPLKISASAARNLWARALQQLERELGDTSVIRPQQMPEPGSQ